MMRAKVQDGGARFDGVLEKFFSIRLPVVGGVNDGKGMDVSGLTADLDRNAAAGGKPPGNQPFTTEPQETDQGQTMKAQRVEPRVRFQPKHGQQVP